MARYRVFCPAIAAAILLFQSPWAAAADNRTAATAAAVSTTRPQGQGSDRAKKLVAAAESALAGRGLAKRDLISRSDAKAVIEALAAAGWTPLDEASLVSRTLADNNFLVTRLRTSAGRKFYEQVAGNRRNLDRLDQMARLPQGKHVVGELIEQKDGPKMLEFMTAAGGNQRLANLLSAAPPGVDLNKSTGRIYTVEQLLTELRASYDRQFPAR